MEAGPWRQQTAFANGGVYRRQDGVAAVDVVREARSPVAHRILDAYGVVGPDPAIRGGIAEDKRRRGDRLGRKRRLLLDRTRGVPAPPQSTPLVPTPRPT